MKHYCYTIPDYEHEGDIAWAKQHILEHFPKVQNINGYEERDYEAESDYENEYGECDEHIYQGYIEFDAPDEYSGALENFLW